MERSPWLVACAFAIVGCTPSNEVSVTTTTPTHFEEQVASLTRQRCGYYATPGTVRKYSGRVGSAANDVSAVANALCRST